uniref:Uncharacterized protein n=1 Tax=Cucumis melo TaxID=3656 RepID=A0A9I9CNK4_CUCME
MAPRMRKTSKSTKAERKKITAKTIRKYPPVPRSSRSSPSIAETGAGSSFTAIVYEHENGENCILAG